jgi:thiol-disulfide isomerase/thioredoxin
MITEIKSLDELQSGLNVVLFYSNECKACQAIKPQFEEAAPKYVKSHFSKIELNEQSFEDYKKLVPSEPMFVEALNDDGSPILRANGQPLLTNQLDENGEPALSVPINIPHFFVFNGTELLGDVIADIGKLEQILVQLEEQL